MERVHASGGRGETGRGNELRGNGDGARCLVEQSEESAVSLFFGA